MRQRLLDWFDHRTGYRDLMKEALDEPIPGGSRWRYVWGSTLVFTFFVQVVTGFVLWACYSPSTRTAWESVYYIQNEMTLGWLVRGIHHFAAQAMVILLVFHLVQVVIDGAYRAPREVNFWLGLILMQIVLGLGLTGYLLPWDQKGYYATQVATEIMGSTPVVGPSIQQVMQGGSEYGHHTLTRFFALHAGLLPALLVGFLFLHIYVFRRHAIHVKQPDRGPAGEVLAGSDSQGRRRLSGGAGRRHGAGRVERGRTDGARQRGRGVLRRPARVVLPVSVPLPQVRVGLAGGRGDASGRGVRGGRAAGRADDVSRADADHRLHPRRALLQRRVPVGRHAGGARTDGSGSLRRLVRGRPGQHRVS